MRDGSTSDVVKREARMREEEFEALLQALDEVREHVGGGAGHLRVVVVSSGEDGSQPSAS
jgi:hypothetical protein